LKKISLLSTDTLHHRALIKELSERGIFFDSVVFESTSVLPQFEIGPCFDQEQEAFELANWGKVELDIEPIIVENINSPDTLRFFSGRSTDMAVVFGTRRIAKPLLEKFDLIINVHRGQADRYRGLDSDLWAAYHSDWGGLGVTVHVVDENLDTGDLVCWKQLALFKNLRCSQIRYYTTNIAIELIFDSIRNYCDGRLVAEPQTEVGRYYSFMPLSIKKIVEAKFNKYCEQLNE
jgi:folate-dependent phosphoribosylglycinamide formyltransferase PurN